MPTNKTLAVLRALVEAKQPLSRHELRIAARLPEDSEVTRPARDLRKHEIEVERTDTYHKGVRIARYQIKDVSFGRAINLLHSYEKKAPATPNTAEDERKVPASTSSIDDAPSPASSIFLIRKPLVHGRMLEWLHGYDNRLPHFTTDRNRAADYPDFATASAVVARLGGLLVIEERKL